MSKVLKRYNDEVKTNKMMNWSPVIFLVVVLILLQLVIDGFNVPKYILPSPLLIVKALGDNLTSMLPDVWITLQEILIGFVIAVPLGILAAILITQYPLINTALTPYILFITMTPMIALIPLLMIWLGFGLKVRVIAVVLQAFGVVMMNAATGFGSVDPLKLELMKSLGASRIQTIKEVLLPSAVHHIFTGIRLSGIFAVTAAISSEFTGGTQGLGINILTSTSFLKTDIAFVGILFTSALGILLYLLISYIEKRIVKWEK